MAKNGPLIVVEDDPDAQKQIYDALTQIRFRKKIEFFPSAESALEYLGNTGEQPFIILTKMMLPGMNGIAFLDKIYENMHLKNKSVPFIFLANVDYPDIVEEAYDRWVQGYFLKPQTFLALKLMLISITDYWERAIHPVHTQVSHN